MTVDAELLHAAKSAVRWLGKAVADDAFANCVNPQGAKSDLLRLEQAIAKATASHPSQITGEQ